MDSKVKIFVEQLKSDNLELLAFFETVEFQKVVVNKKEQKWLFFFVAPQIIPSKVNALVNHYLIENFPYDANVQFIVNSDVQVTQQLVYQYFDSFLQAPFLDSDFLKQALSFATLRYDKNTLFISCADTAQRDKFKEKNQCIVDLFANVGIKLQLNVEVNADALAKFETEVQAKVSADDKKVQAEISRIVEENKKAQSNADRNTTKSANSNGSWNNNGNRNGRGGNGKLAATTFNDKMKENLVSINDAHNIGEQIIVEGYVFDKDIRKTKNGRAILTLKITDYSDSIYVSKWLNSDEELADVSKGSWIYVFGKLEIDPYKNNERVIRLSKYQKFEKVEKKDTAEKKRIELHAHTKMSQLDGVVAAEDLVTRAIQYGQPAIAITDHAVVHSFPNAYSASGRNSKIKCLFGCEFNVVDYTQTDIFYLERSPEILQKRFDECTYIVFDIETTGLSQNFNKIIEIAAVKLENNIQTTTFESFVNPEETLSPFTVGLTSIQQTDVDAAPKIEEVIQNFITWCGDLDNVIFVAHNAHFDVPFIQAVYHKVTAQSVALNFIDSLQMARYLYPQMKRHGLKAMTKYLNVMLEHHHRAIADTKATADIFIRMISDFKTRDLKVVADFNELVTSERAHIIDYSFHINVLAKDDIGLKNLFKLVSFAHIDYFSNEARIPLAVLEEYQEGLLLGSACQNNDVFQAFLSNSNEKIIEKMAKYDYIEVQPPQNYKPLIDTGVFKTMNDVYAALTEFIQLAKNQGKIVVATGDVHQLDERDTIIRQIYIDTQTGVHPLARKGIEKIPATYLMTTEEMKEAFAFLNNHELIEEIVVDNTHLINEMINPIEVIKNELFTPSMENVEENTRKIVYENAHARYGNPLPQNVEERLERELTSIITHGFTVIYYICHLIVKKSLDDGYIVGSRGSVGSSLVATMMDITEVNPMPPHYVCPNCQYSEFHAGELGSGFDLANKECPNCSSALKKDGHDIPFETFLGFKGDKVPDIDLNFSGEYQPTAHDYTKVLFGEDYVYRAGTISTIADKTAYGYVRNYANEHLELSLSNLEVDRLTGKLAGVKKTTGRHAGGVIVVPKEMEIYDITPVQYPADGKTGKEWKTTHFDFHAIHDNLLKLDLLGHDDPTIIRMLQDLSGIKPQEIPIDDHEVYSLFSSSTALNLQKEIFSNTGSLGLPEFGTDFVRQMLEQTHPKTFSDLLQISGLSHGTDVWLNNAQTLVENGTCELKDVIGCRDDIMVYLIYSGLEPSDAFTIMELTRKGQFTEANTDYIEIMKNHNVPDWYIDSCIKIKYMFPKAHATAYVMMAIRIAWFKVHKPLYFYAATFSVRGSGKTYEIETIMGGYEIVKARIKEINNMENPTNKELDTKATLDIILEMQARGFNFKMVDLYKSDAKNFLVEDNCLVFPFQAVDGLGGNVAKKVIEERGHGEFLSKEDLQKRTGLSKTVMAKMEVLRVLEDLDDMNQMSLF